MTRPLTLVCAAKLQPAQLERHLEPLERLDRVARIILVRHAPVAAHLTKVEHVAFTERGVAVDTVQMFRKLDEVLRRERVDFILGFNPVPWGSVAWAAGARHRVPVSISLLGSDFRRLLHPLAQPLWRPLRHSRMVTVTGEKMRAALVERGVAAEHVHVLPHGIDMQRFAPSDQVPTYDVVFAGQLVAVKRVDVILDAVRRLRDRGRSVRVAIAGHGPLRNELTAQVERLGLSRDVELLGFRTDIETVLRSGRVFVIASESEGTPFALIEAMASGLVPVVTNVGTIGELVHDGVNGRLVAGDPGAIAAAIEALLGDKAQYDAMRERALEVRRTLSLDVATAFWRTMFERYL